MLLLKRSEAVREDERAVAGSGEPKMARRDSPQVELRKVCRQLIPESVFSVCHEKLKR